MTPCWGLSGNLRSGFHPQTRLAVWVPTAEAESRVSIRTQPHAEVSPR